ncbi:MAG: ABC transporter ATP-binding protein/permease [Actinomycetota bacterium]|nr:ABC transporter ATP-binding protein/permease [Actinomycetota bacterium]
MTWRGHASDTGPAPLGETTRATAGALRLSWDADRRRMLVVIGVSVATVAAETVQLLSGGRAVDAVVAGDDPGSQTRRLLVVGTAALLAIAGKNVGSALQQPLTGASHRRAEGRILDVVAGLELADVEDPAFQDRLQQAFVGAHRQSMLVGSALSIPSAVAGLGASVLTMSAHDRALVPLGLVGAGPRWLLTRKTGDPMAAMRGRGRVGREAAMLRVYLTGGTAAHELRAFGAAAFLRSRYDQLAESDAAVLDTATRDYGRRSLLASLASRAAEAPAAGRLALRVTRREASVADAVTGGLAARRTAGGFQRIVDSVALLRRHAALAADYDTFVTATRPRRAAGGRPPPATFRRISVEDVAFTYRGAGRPVLDGVRLHIDQGEVVALVGENGCGKTTLAKILCRLYEPTAGAIRWDGADIAGFDPASVRARVAAVFQDFARYPSFTAAENIGIGLPARMRDREAIVEAATSAGAHAAVAALPKGYDTVLSRQFGGVDLSTGQWQRVALARAFLRDAPLVVLDEPTAALDPRAERDLFETVASLYRSRAAVLISHRLSSVRFADRICVLAGGRIIESGTHDELLGATGAYAELFELQARAYR